jgi:sphinganine-1-phosphate aldolase
MEREVVAMTAALLGGGPLGRASVCGCLTSGGSESILTAIRATRDFFAAERVRARIERALAVRVACANLSLLRQGITAPEMVVAVSAHAAVHKAAAYFGVRLVRVPVEAGSLRIDVAAARRALTPNTILLYASAPGFPHGVIDDVAALAALARAHGCGLHVDACLGGFVLPFAAAAGRAPLPPFDFRVAGVTSMSADTHKFGLAQKGSSVLLYANAALRRYQYTAVTDWSGGLYISPSAAGSRPGGLIAQTWASLMARLRCVCVRARVHKR